MGQLTNQDSRPYRHPSHAVRQHRRVERQRAERQRASRQRAGRSTALGRGVLALECTGPTCERYKINKRNSVTFARYNFLGVDFFRGSFFFYSFFLPKNTDCNVQALLTVRTLATLGVSQGLAANVRTPASKRLNSKKPKGYDDPARPYQM